MTLRQALLFLESESRIFRKDRRGWFAALPRFNYNPNSSTSFKQAAIEQGRCPSWDYMTKECVLAAPGFIKELLQVDAASEIYKISGWGALDNHIVFYHETFISPRVAPGFIERLGENSFAEVWEQAYGTSTRTRHLAFKPTRLSGERKRQHACDFGRKASCRCRTPYRAGGYRALALRVGRFLY